MIEQDTIFSAPSGSLAWVDLPECRGVIADDDRHELERVLHSGRLERIYTMGRRSVYKGTLSDGRKIAIKEVCYLGAFRQFKMRHFREAKVRHEFCSGCEYLAKGGKTPRFLGMALEQNALLLRRGFIFIEWLDGAVTLTEHLRDRGGDESDGFWKDLAASLVISAGTGLVHGGHSPENVMVVSDEDDPVTRFQVIDFADSCLYAEFNDVGFAIDVSRIGARMVMEGACNRRQSERFLDAVVNAAWPEADERSKWSEDIQHRVDDLLSGRKKM